jgi:hypothetical protein
MGKRFRFWTYAGCQNWRFQNMNTQGEVSGCFHRAEASLLTAQLTTTCVTAMGTGASGHAWQVADLSKTHLLHPASWTEIKSASILCLLSTAEGSI